ncbi:FUSC family protein [Streptomyces actuosus]|uniref:FUSC family protein n=2 Tax=Streptomyces actuosus TaxID=1885 RepID=A0ABS2VXE7_STRAS|nr:FUSC family protein [Streptomyces actuosus]
MRYGTSASAYAGRRAVRVTLAAVSAFYVSLYGLHQPVTATYGLFAVVAMAGLSRIPGTGRQRAVVIARLLPVGWLLVTAGTLLAVHTWTATAGILVIGFLIAYSAVTGPRPAGAAPGLQLLYILPCFPPYAPQTLDERLGGMTFGVLLLVLAESLLLPDPPSTSYRDLSADAAMTAARCATELTRPPWTLSSEADAAARSAGEALRPSEVPESERPAGPGPRERALAHTGMAARVLLARLQEAPGTGPQGPRSETLALLHEVAASARRTTAALRTGRPAGPGQLGEALAVYQRRRTVAPRRKTNGETNGETPETVDRVMYRQAMLIETAHAGVTLAAAADLALGRLPEPAETRDGGFWYAGQGAARLWGHRLRAHLSPHSVYFQNAVRISLALAAARAVAGLGSLPHGFWAMLAVLTLTRTTAAQTGAIVGRALVGTLLGALVAAAMLVLVSGNTAAYAVALPVIMLATFWFGPTHGVGWAQGLFTLVVSLVFAQLAPSTWQLAEVRFLDVLIGSSIGLVFGLLAWPRGAQMELRRDVAALLRAIGSTVTSTVSSLTHGAAEERNSLLPLRRALTLAESSFAQFQSEPQRPGTAAVDWHAALIAGHHALRGARRLLAEGPPTETPSPAPAWQRGLDTDGDVLAERYAMVGGLLEGARPPPSRTRPPVPGETSDGRPQGLPASPLYYDAEAWLTSLSADLDHVAATAAAASSSSEAVHGP